MDIRFVNRSAELERLSRVRSGLIVVYGRRRVGKSALIDTLFRSIPDSVVSQAIEAAPSIQREQLFHDLNTTLRTELVPQSWEQLFELIDRHPRPLHICIDEFPYLVTSDPSVPSRFQRWIDRTAKRDLRLVLCGSSVRMMTSTTLSEDSPLFGRAQEIICLQPMGYKDYCTFSQNDPSARESFLLYSLLGGIPKYWQLVLPHETPIQAATRLFFTSGAYMNREPFRMLKDEKIEGISPLSVLEAIGRGAHRPREIAARMEVSQTSISKLLQLLLETSVIQKRTRFGDSERKTKIVHYRISDPSVRFWFSVYSPHRSRWEKYDEEFKTKLMTTHAGSILEDVFSSQHPEGKTYWENDLEIDLIRPGDHVDQVIVSEVKWKSLSKADKERIRKNLIKKWHLSKLSGRFKEVEYEVLSFEDIARSGSL
ncbi:ATP-binding protein [bacterium]|nr:ATP-binding protein [bacterium]